MPSPFPGMDPYMENPAKWPSVHHALTTYIRDQIEPQLGPRYAAEFNIRYVSDDPEFGLQIMYPDVAVVEQWRSNPPPRPASTATAAAPPLLVIPTIIPVSTKLVSIEIHSVDEERLVTVIELLSPVNKRGTGQAEYVSKRNTLLHSDVHLLEIDLLRGGERVPMRVPLPPAPYFAFLSRAEQRPMCEVWPIGLRDPLPVLPVPLLPPDADVTIDLGAAVAEVYERANYEARLDYRPPPPPPPLPAEDAAWVDERLRAAGRR